MAQPYVGEIRIFAGNFAPAGWLMCDGTPLPISEYETLFQLIGTTYGGDGESTFNLPDLRGRLPLHQGSNAGSSFIVGEALGTEEVTLTTQQMPTHNHTLLASLETGNVIPPGGNLSANSQNISPYLNQPPDGAMNSNAVTVTGGSQPHENRQPFLGLNFIISLFGIFPSPT